VSGTQKNILKDCHFISKCFKRRNTWEKSWRL